MSTAGFSQHSPHLDSAKPRAFALTRAGYLVNVAYLLWFWVTFAAGYWVYSWFDLDPGVDALADAGVGGRIALAAWALTASVPSWFGTVFAVRSLRGGGGKAAASALILNLALIVGFLVWIILAG